MASEQNTVGLTATGSANLNRLMESGWFNSELDACRVAMVVAIKRHLTSKPEELVKMTTKYNIGTFDRDGQVRVILQFGGFPDGSYEPVEGLIHAGLRVLAEELSVEGAVLLDSLVKQGNPAATTS